MSFQIHEKQDAHYSNTARSVLPQVAHAVIHNLLPITNHPLHFKLRLFITVASTLLSFKCKSSVHSRQILGRGLTAFTNKIIFCKIETLGHKSRDISVMWGRNKAIKCNSKTLIVTNGYQKNTIYQTISVSSIAILPNQWDYWVSRPSHELPVQFI